MRIVWVSALAWVFVWPGPVLANTGEETGRAEQSSAATASDSEIARQLATLGTSRDAEDRRQLAEFYASRQNRPLWVEADRLNARGASVLAEIARADDWGLNAADFQLPAGISGTARLADAELLQTEVKLSLAVLKYARHARGGRFDPRQLSRAIDRTPPLLDPLAVLDGIAAAEQPDAYLRSLHPQHPQFERLRQLLFAMRKGELPQETSSAPSETARRGKAEAVKRAEQGSPRKILHNMEMWRWMPPDLGRTYVWINVPEFTLRVVKDGEVIHSERVITGKVYTQTPIFSSEMASVVFHPAWGVPNSIKVKELLPGLLRGGDTLARNGLVAYHRGRRVDAASVDWAATDIREVSIHQPPGGANVLGVVKFQFPNKHDVYLHDTPTKNLFNVEERVFSHGCIRLRNPVRMAELVLGEDKGWDAERIAALLKGGPQNNTVTLDRTIPVHITYFTATVDEAGTPGYFRDVYGHEARIQQGLEGKAHLLVQKRENLGTERAEIVARNRSSKKTWVENLFNF